MSNAQVPGQFESLADLYPKATEEMYKACHEGAAKHTGPGTLFGQLATDPQEYPLQHVDCQIVPATPIPLEVAFVLGDKMSADFSARTEGFIEDNDKTLDEVHQALANGHNVILAIPTHSQVHDIALSSSQVAMGLFRKHKIDNAADRYIIFSKALNWYSYEGSPVPEVGRTIANIVFSLPHSRSGDSFDKSLQKDFNTRALQALDEGMAEGGKLITLATGGSTNYKLTWRDQVYAESQGAIHPGTERLMSRPNTLVLPIASYIDPQTRIHTRLGNLVSLHDEADASEDKSGALEIGIWAAQQYSEMSGIHTLQARTRAQHERFARTKVRELQEAMAKGIGFVAHLVRSPEETNQPTEQAE